MMNLLVPTNEYKLNTIKLLFVMLRFVVDNKLISFLFRMYVDIKNAIERLYFFLVYIEGDDYKVRDERGLDMFY